MGKEAKSRAVALVAALNADTGESEKHPGLSATERGRYKRWREHAAALEEHVRAQKGSSVTASDLAGLPDELLRELSIARGDPLDAQIVAVFQSLGGSADLDQLLIGLFRKYSVVQKRRFLQNKLWRMVRKGQIEKSGRGRGHFSLVAHSVRKRAKKRRK